MSSTCLPLRSNADKLFNKSEGSLVRLACFMFRKFLVCLTCKTNLWYFKLLGNNPDAHFSVCSLALCSEKFYTFVPFVVCHQTSVQTFPTSLYNKDKIMISEY